MIVGVIPARYASTRLPAKPLVDLCGQTMVERVWRSARAASGLDLVVIATDHADIVAEARRIGAEVVLTSPHEQSGTDRCAAALRVMGISAEIVVNIQGDEPLLEPYVVTELVQRLQSTGADVSTPVSPITNPDELTAPHIVKVALNHEMRALYFSRAPIPFRRDATMENWLDAGIHWKHIGLYAYTAEALRRHTMLPSSSLERAEQLEQLRMLEQGAYFTCVPTDAQFVSVDTPEDADRVRGILAQRLI